MKLKTLLIVILALAALSAATYFLNRPDRPLAADDRVGRPLVDRASVDRAARVEIAENGKTVRLQRSATGGWTVASYHDLPANFSKLASLVESFASADVERFVTQNPERLSRLEFSDTRFVLADADGRTLVALTLGKHAEGGGRFVKFDDAPKAYLSRVDAWLDATDRNWADTTLLSVPRDDIAEVTLTFDSGDPLTLTRADKDAPFTATTTPAGRQLKTSAVNSLLGNFANLRFSEPGPADAPDAVAARAHARTITLKTFDGKTHTVSLGRRPEQLVVKPEATKPEPETALALAAEIAKPAPLATEPEKAGPAAVVGPLTEKVPAGPVFAFVTHSDASAPINALMSRLSFQIGEHTYNALPARAADFFEPAPEPAKPAEAATNASAPASPVSE